MSQAKSLKRVTALLIDLRQELQIQTSAERRALIRLKMKAGSFGWTPLTYEEGAFEIWKELLTRFPNDTQTMHHLAIMHHARAFDLEQGTDPDQANPDWKRALELWHHLWQEDAFWDDLAKRLEPGIANPYPQIRQQWPRDLLDVHADIALDEHSKNYRRREHIRLILESPFPDEIKDRVRADAFERATQYVSSSVWESVEFDPQRVTTGLRAVAAYLEVDEEFLPALKDLLRLLCKLQSSHVQRINASEGEEEERGLRVLATLSLQYSPYLTRLEQNFATLEADTLSDLTMWHQRSGQAHRMLGNYALATTSFSLAYRAAQVDGSPNAGGMRVEWIECGLTHARALATGEADQQAASRDLLAQFSVESDLPASCMLLRADAYRLLEDFDAAETNCRAALSLIEFSKKNRAFRLSEDPEHLESQAGQLQKAIDGARRRHAANVRLGRAEAAMKPGGDPQEALRLLNQAVAIDPDNMMALFHRASCRLKLLDAAGARIDADRVIDLMAETSVGNMMLAKVRQIRTEIDDLQRDLDTYGGIDAYRIRQQAWAAFERREFESAARALRHAINAAQPGGREALVADLRHVQEAWATRVLEPAREQFKANDISGAISTCGQALAICPDFLRALFLRAQCRLASGDAAEANIDSQAAEAAARRIGDQQSLEALANLRERVNLKLQNSGGGTNPCP